MYRSGFVTVVGRPNVGKSTLLNEIVGEKISIISDKPQTTRNKIQLVYTDRDYQIVFLDTPGIQMPKNKLGEYMLKISKETLEEVDIITFMVDSSFETGRLDNYIIKELGTIKTPIILLINKIDTINKEDVEKLVLKYEQMNMFHKIIPVSAINGTNIDLYIRTVKDLLPEGPQYFPEDMITDQPERFIISEIIREKALLNLQEEVPHGIFVGIEEIKKRQEQDLIDVFATIYCEKESHKGIIIGKNGRMLKTIGQQSRSDIEKLLGSRVNLQIWVKVEKNWREKEAKVKYFGYR
ncbi:GTPase Era [Tepidimicrobium xylanilyticum]|uniref:GTPase Era n=1 Tax=Tepidimicrobium xylanilyticum TaxID=1123352 RepID=A0A1H2T1H3_9FIRM|nr:GTPase Era [Tepidimicrobium xylanilyticum]GMG96049.1 GTPase Era [Tepidimicrobium xylanilyticum]SDW37708.1 GTP-binding protein Era [Tepidimicrobium xylanilyticum]